MSLTILAQITAAEGAEDVVRTELLKLIDITRAEQGCLQYDLHVDNEKPGFFVLYETWENRALWRDHMNAPHLAAFASATKGAVATIIINEMTKIA